ncbi:hypothetical protein PRZ48_009201 [Zasmidium cellare]|uniref:Uncharacterized protein n=1 Tax=Zasmidium cellare TaxID=395010 RepID=A0ABR0EB38_ZASCE|nr:hypothetical protein PRZ48_009201 [Zasmidium cellare]
MAPKKKRAAAVQKSTDHGPGPDESNASKSGGFAFSKRCKLEKCLACEDNYPTGHQYSGSISAGDAKSVINGHITSINQSVAELSRILSSNGDDVMSAWTNIKDKKKRDAIVSKALPDGFPATKWNLIFVYISHSQGKISGDRDQHRQSFLLPFIGRAELVDYPSKLLKLLDLRTVYKPSQWAPMDHAATEYGRATGMLSTRFSETMFSTRMHDYGQPVDYDETAFHGREISGFSTAELMLEAQRHLYSFLCSVAKLLLEKAAPLGKHQDSGNALWKKRSEGGFREFALENETLDRRPFYEPTNPYEPPLQFDIREPERPVESENSKPGTGGDLFERQVRTNAFSKAGPLLKRFLDIKVPRDLSKRSIQWLEKAEQSKLALNAFWREVWLVKFEQAMNGDSRTANKVAQWRDIDLLGEYQRDGFLAAYRSEIQTLKAAEKAKEEEKKRQPKPSLKRLPSSDEWQGFRGEEKTSPKKPKTAPKNPNKRSHAIDEHDKGPIPVPMPGLAPPPAPAPPAPKIEVSAASLRVLARLWPVQSRAYLDEGGTIRWRGFQAAMAEVGFQCFPRGGSIFSFESREMGRINIHGPHGTVVNDGLLASYGRRLKNKWGWGYDTFAERTRGD